MYIFQHTQSPCHGIKMIDRSFPGRQAEMSDKLKRQRTPPPIDKSLFLFTPPTNQGPTAEASDEYQF
jgi:hypothetical protein